MTFSFDIFDTCLVRKCGTPENFLDVLSYMVFSGDVLEDVRQKFIVERRKAASRAYADDKAKLFDIYNNLEYTHPLLFPKEKLIDIELECERLMLVPVLCIKNKIDEIRSKGQRIIFISDMYLSLDFIKSILEKYGICKEGDAIYVSCEGGKTKSSGELFRYIKEKEHLEYSGWEHYGDNIKNDFQIPKSLGIKVRRVEHIYAPYQKKWISNDFSRGYKFPSILAGISRSVRYSNENNQHKDFVLDIIAPFYCSFVYKVLKSAADRKITKLFFCARDAYQMYRIAQKMQPLFPSIEINYLYISRDALYNGEEDAKMGYFKQIGLTSETEQIALVDTTTSGKTLRYINDWLYRQGYRKLYGFYFLLWDDKRNIDVDYDNSHFELSQAYIRDNHLYSPFLSHIWIFENFFGLNDQPKTVGYDLKEGNYIPIFSEEIGNEDCVSDNQAYWSSVHEDLLCKYAEAYMQTQIYRYSDAIFSNIALPTLLSFFTVPEKLYLSALLEYRRGASVDPYVRKESMFRLLRSRGRDSKWRRGTLIYNLPQWLVDMNFCKKILLNL